MQPTPIGGGSGPLEPCRHRLRADTFILFGPHTNENETQSHLSGAQNETSNPTASRASLPASPTVPSHPSLPSVPSHLSDQASAPSCAGRGSSCRPAASGEAPASWPPAHSSARTARRGFWMPTAPITPPSSTRPPATRCRRGSSRASGVGGGGDRAGLARRQARDRRPPERQLLGLRHRRFGARVERLARELRVERGAELRGHDGADRGDRDQARDARDRVVDAPSRSPPRLSSTPARTAAVSGATVIDRPSENTRSPGSTSVR